MAVTPMLVVDTQLPWSHTLPRADTASPSVLEEEGAGPGKWRQGPRSWCRAECLAWWPCLGSCASQTGVTCSVLRSQGRARTADRWLFHPERAHQVRSHGTPCAWGHTTSISGNPTPVM